MKGFTALTLGIPLLLAQEKFMSATDAYMVLWTAGLVVVTLNMASWMGDQAS